MRVLWLLIFVMGGHFAFGDCPQINGSYVKAGDPSVTLKFSQENCDSIVFSQNGGPAETILVDGKIRNNVSYKWMNYALIKRHYDVLFFKHVIQITESYRLNPDGTITWFMLNGRKGPIEAQVEFLRTN